MAKKASKVAKKKVGKKTKSTPKKASKKKKTSKKSTSQKKSRGRPPKPVDNKMREFGDEMAELPLTTDRFNEIFDIMAKYDWDDNMQKILEGLAEDAFAQNTIVRRFEGYRLFNDFLKILLKNRLFIKDGHIEKIKNMRDQYEKEMIDDTTEIEFISKQCQLSAKKHIDNQSEKWIKNLFTHEELAQEAYKKIQTAATYDPTLPRAKKGALIKEAVKSSLKDEIRKRYSRDQNQVDVSYEEMIEKYKD